MVDMVYIPGVITTSGFAHLNLTRLYKKCPTREISGVHVNTLFSLFFVLVNKKKTGRDRMCHKIVCSDCTMQARELPVIHWDHNCPALLLIWSKECFLTLNNLYMIITYQKQKNGSTTCGQF